MFESIYLEIIDNIRKTINPIEILNNYDNLKYIFEKEKYQKRVKK